MRISNSQEQTYGLPIDIVDSETLQEEQPLKYDEISKLVGSLYIDANHRIQIIQERANTIINKLKCRIEELVKENLKLKEELSINRKDNE